jgi:FG-GAP repeat
VRPFLPRVAQLEYRDESPEMALDDLRTIAAACERALVSSARGAGTRQQVRAAARRFVRRHRRDGPYLSWVRRSVAARSAFAAVLLGLSAAPAAAELAPFAGLTAAENPLIGRDVGSYSTPAFGDLDGDGDLDLVTGASDGTFHVHYFPEPARGLLLGAGVSLLAWLRAGQGWARKWSSRSSVSRSAACSGIQWSTPSSTSKR